MDTAFFERVKVKTPEHLLYRELQDDYGLNKIDSKVLVQRVMQFQEENLASQQRSKNQIVRQVVARGEPAGKRLDQCRLVEVNFTVDDPEDLVIASKEGLLASREAKLHRLCLEAYQQGGALTEEDLSNLLGLSLSTIKRIIKRLKQKGLEVPTRGNIEDIGPGVTHKARIIELLLKDYTYFQIQVYSGHCAQSIEHYERDFSRVVYFYTNDKSAREIRVLTNQSEKVIKEYIELYKSYLKKPDYKEPLRRMLERFSSYLEDEGNKKKLFNCSGLSRWRSSNEKFFFIS